MGGRKQKIREPKPGIYIIGDRYFKNAKAVETALKKYCNDYEKTTQFLEKEKWVVDLCSENKLTEAIGRSKRSVQEYGSYTNVHEVFDVLLNDVKG